MRRGAPAGCSARSAPHVISPSRACARPRNASHPPSPSRRASTSALLLPLLPLLAALFGQGAASLQRPRVTNVAPKFSATLYAMAQASRRSLGRASSGRRAGSTYMGQVREASEEGPPATPARDRLPGYKRLYTCAACGN